MTKEEAITQVLGGADVLSYELAMTLRECEKEKLVQITEVMGKYKVEGKLPYFGAIATKKGLDYIRNSKTFLFGSEK